MKTINAKPRRALLFALFTLFIVGIFTFHSNSENFDPLQMAPLLQAEVSNGEKMDKKSRVYLAAKQEFDRTKDPTTGEVPRERLRAAYKYMNTQQPETKTPISGIEWEERGPNNVGGRTRAILIDANDATGRTVFAAGVAGGIFRTDDITATSPNWTPVDDFFVNMAITTIVQDPSNSQVIYFGTGEGYLNTDAVRGDGIWKSSDGGTTWTQLASTIASTSFDFVQTLAIDPSTGNVFAATRNRSFSNVGGLMRSTNGGTSWTNVLTGTSSGSTWAADVVVAANNDIYASIGIAFSDGIYKSTNSGTSWAQVYTSAADERRIDLAAAPSDANYVYALVQQSTTNEIKKIMRTTNGGTSWPSLASASWSDQCDAAVADFTRGQAFYDLAVAVDPNDRNVAWIGGVDLFLTTDGGSSWTQMTEWANCSGLTDVHADQHYMVYHPGSSDTLYFGNDGGIYRSDNATSFSPTITSKEANYRTIQFYSAAMHPDVTSNHFLAGAQDNGTQLFSTHGINSTIEATGGDGAFCHIDQNQSSFQFTAAPFNNYRRSTDGGATFSNVNVDETGSFINPTDYDNTANLMFCGTDAGNYKVWLDPQTGSSFTNVAVAAFGGGEISAVSCSQNTSERVWFGLDNGRVVRVDNAATAPSATNISGGSFPSSSVSCIAVEEGDDSHLLATFFAYGVTSVFESTNSGTSWSAVEGNLPDMPIRWAMFQPNNANGALLATELGVWTTDNLNGASTNWGPSNSGLANVRVDMLQLRASDSLIVAATHGRGLYSTDAFSPEIAQFTASRTCWFASLDLDFTDLSLAATSWSWDFGDGNVSTAQNPTHSYAAAGSYSVTLSINSGADSEVKINFIQIAAAPSIPYSDDFNGDDGCWSSSILSGSGGLWEWGVCNSPNLNAGNGTASLEGANSWATNLNGSHGFFTKYALESPPYNMVGATGSYELSFSYRSIAGTDAGMNLEVSTDGGVSWSTLGSVGDPLATNWYTTAAIGGLDSEPGWRQFSFSVFNPTYDITAFIGESDLRFRFVMGALGSAGDGFQIDEFEINGNPIVLPVEMSNLTGSWTDEGPRLNWKTFSEYRNNGFEVQRSINGKDFESISWIDGEGNSTSTMAYSFLDEKAINDIYYYYRIAQQDFDGNTFLSNVVALTKAGKSTFNLSSIYPNPFQNQINIDLESYFKGNISINLYDLRGRIVFNENLQNLKGKIISLDLRSTQLAPGAYFLQLESGNLNYLKKVLHQ